MREPEQDRSQDRTSGPASRESTSLPHPTKKTGQNRSPASPLGRRAQRVGTVASCGLPGPAPLCRHSLSIPSSARIPGGQRVGQPGLGLLCPRITAGPGGPPRRPGDAAWAFGRGLPHLRVKNVGTSGRGPTSPLTGRPGHRKLAAAPQQGRATLEPAESWGSASANAPLLALEDLAQGHADAPPSLSAPWFIHPRSVALPNAPTGCPRCDMWCMSAHRRAPGWAWKWGGWSPDHPCKGGRCPLTQTGAAGTQTHVCH